MPNNMESNVILKAVIDMLQAQTDKGVSKYGHMVELESLPAEAWLKHAQEEIIDLLVYLECLKQKIYNNK